MQGYRKLGRATDQRIAILRNLVTAFFQHEKLETTQARAKEVQKIAETLIATAIKEASSFTTKEVKVSRAKLLSNGKKETKTVTSKNGNSYEVVEREITTKLVEVDSPARLAARRKIAHWINRPRTEDGLRANIINKIFSEIAPKFKDRKGGYTRIYKLGPRRGDAAELVILKFVD